MSTTTFYPTAGANSPVDGNVIVDDVTLGTVWSTVRSQSNADHAYVTDTNQYTFRTEKISSRYSIDRSAFLFDLTSISGDTVTGATMSLYLLPSGGSTTQAVTLFPVTSSLASNANVVVGDYAIANWGSTKLADTGIANSATKGQYQDMTFNASGVTVVDNATGGVVSLGTRSDLDIDNTAPTARSYWQIYWADQTGTANDPKLTVTHSAGATNEVASINGISNTS